jgi:hypothetical protein
VVIELWAAEAFVLRLLLLLVLRKQLLCALLSLIFFCGLQVQVRHLHLQHRQHTNHEEGHQTTQKDQGKEGTQQLLT